MDNNGLSLPDCSSDGVIFIVIVLFAHLFCGGMYIFFVIIGYIIFSLSNFIQQNYFNAFW